MLGSSRDELKQLADLLHPQLSGIGAERSLRVTHAQANYIEESKDLAALDWLLASLGRNEPPRSRKQGGSKYYDFRALGGVISELPGNDGLLYFEKALGIIEGLDSVAGGGEELLLALVDRLRGGDVAVCEAMFDRAAATRKRLLQRADPDQEWYLHNHNQDPVEEQRQKWRQSGAPPAPRPEEGPPPAASRRELLEDLQRVEKEWGHYNGVGEVRQLSSIFARALRSGDEGLIREIEQRIMQGYTKPGWSSRSVAALQAGWVAKMCEVACKHAPERARAYFVDALARVRADDDALSAVMTLTSCVPTQEPGQSEAARELLGLLEERPNAPGYVAEYICVVLMERGFLAPITRLSYRRDEALLRLRQLLDLRSEAGCAIEARVRGTFEGWAALERAVGPAWDRAARSVWTRLAGSLAPYPAFVATIFEVAALREVEPGQRSAALYLAGRMKNDERRALVQHLFRDPRAVRSIVTAFSTQETLTLARGGNNRSTFLAFVEALLPTDTDGLPNTARFDAAVEQVASLPTRAFDESALGTAWRAHGRTLHFTDSDGARRALKLPKWSRNRELQDEARTSAALALLKEDLHLQSELPRPLEMVTFRPSPGVCAALRAQAEAARTDFGIEPGHMLEALLYEPPEHYETYLHQVDTLEALQQASARTLHDMAALARYAGLVCEAPADMNHNTEHERRYHWNVEQLGAQAGPRFGAGRLERPDQAIGHPNYGASGLRDLKQFKSVAEVAEHGTDMLKDAPTTLMSKLGAFLFAWSLSTGKWFVEHERTADLPELESTLRQGMTTFMTAYTGRDEQGCAALVSGLADWRRLADQMMYFMSGDYRHDVANNRIRPEIYGRSTQVEVVKPEDSTWSDALGWAADGKNPDLGPYNGPFPITELVRSVYNATAFAITLAQTRTQVAAESTTDSSAT